MNSSRLAARLHVCICFVFPRHSLAPLKPQPSTAQNPALSHDNGRHLDPALLRRIERLEIFDEFEEWDLIQSHYCIALGVKDAAGMLADFHLLGRS